MFSTNQPVVHSLLTVVVVLLLGIMAILGVAYQRHRHLEDQDTDLLRYSSQQEIQIRDLQWRLENCDTIQSAAPNKASWTKLPLPNSVRVLTQITRLPH